MHSLMISSKPSTGKQQAGDSAIIACTETLEIFHSIPWKVFLSHFNVGKLEVNSNTNFVIKRYFCTHKSPSLNHHTICTSMQCYVVSFRMPQLYGYRMGFEIPHKAIMDFKMPLTLAASLPPRNYGNFGNSPVIIYTSVLNHLVKLSYTKELHQEITAAFLPHFQTKASWFPVSSPRLTSLC